MQVARMDLLEKLCRSKLDGPQLFQRNNQNVLGAAVRVQSLPPTPGPPQGFLSGLWHGDAVLISKERLEHPTASEDRAQPLCWVLGEDKDQGELCGAGYSSWPAAHVMSGLRGRVWHTVRCKYIQADGSFEIVLQWEAVPGSRFLADGLGPGQGELGPGKAECQRTQLIGRVWWDDRQSEIRRNVTAELRGG